MIDKKSKVLDGILRIIAPIMLMAILLLGWEYAARLGAIPEWAIAKPSSIIEVFLRGFKEHVLPDAIVTVKTILFSYPVAAILGIAFAGIVTNSELVSKAISPYLILLVCTPMMTLVPLLMIVMGFDIKPRILVIILQTFPIINLNSSTGFLNVPTERIELMRSLKASRLTTFFRVSIPSSVTSIFTGLKIGFIACINACIAAEFAGGNDGLGAAIIFHTSFIRMPIALACIVTVAIIGMIGYGLVSLLEKAVVSWEE